MSRVVAVVCSYWNSRIPNVFRIVNDLKASSRPPDKIIILDNNPAATSFADPSNDWADVQVIECRENTWTRGKFIAALFEPAQYYVLMDDDTTVGPRTIETLLKWADGRRGVVAGYWGVTLNSAGSFMQGTIHQTDRTTALKVDAFHGRVVFSSYDSLVRMLAVEESVRFGPDGELRWPHEGDDILIGLANRESRPGPHVVPLSGDAAFVDLEDGGEALQYQDGYFAERDVFTADALEAVRTSAVPVW